MGEVVGVTSVTVPHKAPLAMIRSLNTGFWVSASLVLTLMWAAYVLVLRGLVLPLRMQSRYADRVASSDDRYLGRGTRRPSSGRLRRPDRSSATARTTLRATLRASSCTSSSRSSASWLLKYGS